jgi:hypothetical protein
MTDPVRKLGLEEIPVPDELWSDVLRRGRRPAAPEPHRKRLAAAVVALAITIAGLALVVRVFPRGTNAPSERREPAGVAETSPPPPPTVDNPGRMTDSIVQGMTLTRPQRWTLTHLPGEVDGAWPVFQLTNYDAGLDLSSLCPQAASLPPDGVLLYVQKIVEDASYPKWPVQPDARGEGPGTCGTGLHPRWHMGASSFEGFLAFGPDASDRDRNLLLDAFASLDLRDPVQLQVWHEHLEDRLSFSVILEPAHVLFSVDLGYEESWFRNILRFPTSLVEEEPEGFSIESAFKRGEHIQFGGDASGGSLSRVVGSVKTTADVARVEIHADDGRIINCDLSPVVAGIRLGTFAFEPPLVGEFVAYDEAGNVLDREKYNLWPPD